MKLTIQIAFKHSWAEVIAVKHALERIGEGIWASYTGYHHSKRTMVIVAPSEEYREKIIEITNPICEKC